LRVPAEAQSERAEGVGGGDGVLERLRDISSLCQNKQTPNSEQFKPSKDILRSSNST